MLETDEDFLRTMLNMLVFTKIDYTQFFRTLSRYEKGSFILGEFPSSESLNNWLASYEERLGKEDVLEKERHEKMLAVNPKFILRNYIAQMCIDDHSLIPAIYNVLTHPFDEWMEHDEWARPAPLKYRNLSVSCSS